MKFFKSIGEWFKNLFASPAMKKFEAFIVSVFKAEVALVIGSLSDFATKAVQDAQASGALNSLPFDEQGQAKYNQAFAQIQADAKLAGINAGTSAINLAVEMAVQALKNNTTGTNK